MLISTKVFTSKKHLYKKITYSKKKIIYIYTLKSSIKSKLTRCQNHYCAFTVHCKKLISLPANNRFVHSNQQMESTLSPQGFDRHQHSDNPNLIKKTQTFDLKSQTLRKETVKAVHPIKQCQIIQIRQFFKTIKSVVII